MPLAGHLHLDMRSYGDWPVKSTSGLKDPQGVPLLKAGDPSVGDLPCRSLAVAVYIVGFFEPLLRLKYCLQPPCNLLPLKTWGTL